MNSTHDIHDIEANQEPPVLGIFSVYLKFVNFQLSEGIEDKDNRASETHGPPDMESDVSSSPTRSQQPRENDDFDERSAEFWAVYVREARSHDEASIGTWKDDMEGIIIFVRFQYELVNNSSCAVPLRLVYTRPS
jgi:hypothetical protein